MGMQPSKVEQAAIQAIPDVDEIFVLEIISGLFEHHAEEDGGLEPGHNPVSLHL